MSRKYIANLRSNKIMSVSESAYIAGLVDGEGSVGLWKFKRSENKCGFRFVPALHIANTNLDLLKTCVSYMGNGSIVENSKNNHKENGWKIGYVIHTSSNQIRHILPQIIPYLIAKKKQAILLMEYLDLVVSGQTHNYAMTGKFVEIYSQLKVLNKRGI